MAIARLSMKVGKAGKAGPHAAYIAREGQYAGRLERGERLAATEAGNMPAWAQAEPGQFWQAADAHERANGTTYREMEIALPRELSTGQQIELVRDWVKQELGDKHAYQWAIHVPTAADGGEQPHVHLMFSERQRDGIERDPEQYFKRYNAKAPEKGGARKGYGPEAGKTKTRAERAKELKELRGRWADAANRHLARAGSAERIDMRSLAEQGRAEQPEPKQLPSQWRGAGRGNVIEFRAAKRAAAEAQREVNQVVPALVVDLAKERQARKDRQERAERIEAVRSADPARAKLAAAVRGEFTGRSMAEIEDAQAAAESLALRHERRLDELARDRTSGSSGKVWRAHLDMHHANEDFQKANAELERWRSQHKFRAALGIDNRELLGAAEKAWAELEKAEQVQQRVNAEHLKEVEQSQAGKASAEARQRALMALASERQAEADALDPAAAKRRQQAAQEAEKQRIEAERKKAEEQSKRRQRDRGKGR